jgi:hypothetical protein
VGEGEKGRGGGGEEERGRGRRGEGEGEKRRGGGGEEERGRGKGRLKTGAGLQVFSCLSNTAYSMYMWYTQSRTIAGVRCGSIYNLQVRSKILQHFRTN